MPKHQMRKYLSELAKKNGLGKLYTWDRKAALQYLQRRPGRAAWLERQLKLHPGDVVHDCDGFNHVIKEITWDRCNGVLALDDIVFTDGKIACGCGLGTGEPARLREEIEEYWLGWAKAWKAGENVQGLSQPYEVKLYEAVLNGEHIVDERGVLLPEYQRTVTNE